MNNVTFVSISPGSFTGLTIWDQYGKYINTGTIKYFKHLDYSERLFKTRQHHNIAFAVIEDHEQHTNEKMTWGVDAHASQTQLTICKEIFDSHILISPSQWNRSGHQDYMKRQLTLQTLQLNLRNIPEIDSALIGRYVFQFANRYVGHKTFEALHQLATTTHKWPLLSQKQPWNDLIKIYSEQLSINI